MGSRSVKGPVGKWCVRLLLMLILATGATGLWKRDEIMRLMAVNSLFEADRIVSNFSNMKSAFLHVPMPRGDGPVSELPAAPSAPMPAVLEALITDRHVTSVVVLHEGRLAYESYHQGTGPDDLRIGWSISKSFLSALTGVLVSEGAISNLDDPVTRYAPALIGSAYDGVTIRHVLNMTTGVTFDEDYQDKSSDINRMGRVLALGGLMDDFAAGLTETFSSPGSDWQYVSIDTHVLGMVLRGATRRSVIDLMQEKIIAPLGLEQTPYYLTDGAGVAFALGGVNMTTRDYARFGQMFAQGGVWQGKQIVPRAWVTASTTASAPTTPDEMGYGYQWWLPRDARPREYMGRGIYGQYLYINESARVVIALTAADPDFRGREQQRENLAVFRKIADSF